MSVDVRSEGRGIRAREARFLRQAGRAILAGLALEDAELGIVLCDDAHIHALNRAHRGKDKATDVLSFSQVEGEGVPVGAPVVAPIHLGDVVISAETAARQASARSAGIDEELARLLVHGVLHLLGHDHVHGGRQAGRMRREEERLMRRLRAQGLGRAATKRR